MRTINFFSNFLTFVFSGIKQFVKKFLNSNNLPIFIIFTSWLFSVAARLIKSGNVYGMDFGLFHPDGTNYLRFTQDIVDVNIQDSTIYAWSRPLYPFLSAPFYSLLGKPGMLVIPVFCYLLLGFVFLQFGNDRKTKIFIAFLYLMLSSSSTLLRWVVADLTDSLHLLLFSLCCLGIYKRWNTKYLATLVILGSLARPMGFLWAALFFSSAVKCKYGQKKSYLILSFIALNLFLLNTLLMAVFGGFGPNPKSLVDQISSVPFNFISLLVVEFGQLIVMDRVLFYFAVLSIALTFFNLRDPWSLIHVSVTFVSFLLSAWIGVWGVNFRYQLPVLTTALIVIIRNPYLRALIDDL
jgi:hypothetical protein